MVLDIARRLGSNHLLRRTLTGVGVGLTAALLLSSLAQAQADPTGSDADAATAVNFAWTLTAAALVFFMQAGFALLEAGSIRSKGVANVLTKNIMDLVMAALAFWAFGFAFMFGGSEAGAGLAEGNGFIGGSGFFLINESYDVTTNMVWMFQVVFVATAATIVSGTMAERTRLTAYMAYSFMISAIIYPIYGHWVWGGGWLSELGFLGGRGVADFAGSGVVHAVGGAAALVGGLMVGPRLGRFGRDGKARSMPGHSAVLVVLGTIILFFGWFGFNGGSTLAATELRISIIIVNTFLAACAAAAVAYYIRFIETGGRADLQATTAGLIGGLVAITAPSAWVAPWAAVLIGAVAGAVVVYGARFLETVLKLDDPVWAVAVHYLNGLWGLLAVGIFADGTYGISGLIDRDWQQFLAQLLAIGVVSVWTITTSFLVFWGIKRTIGLRVPREDELAGVDATEHTEVAYPELVAAVAPGTAAPDGGASDTAPLA